MAGPRLPFFGKKPPEPATRPRLRRDDWPEAVYAVGDVHGRLDLLRELEARIVADAAEIAGEKLIVMLGDHVDRGPETAGVLEHLMAPPPAGFKRIALAGNHEQLFLDFLADPVAAAEWMEFGGIASLASYGRVVEKQKFTPQLLKLIAADLRARVPARQLDWLKHLPVSLSLPGVHFVHAGVRPDVPFAQQTDEDLMWIRKPFLLAERPSEALIVHGHTPGEAPVVTKGRICVDTTAFASGVLTAVRLAEGAAPRFIATGKAEA